MPINHQSLSLRRRRELVAALETRIESKTMRSGSSTIPRRKSRDCIDVSAMRSRRKSNETLNQFRAGAKSPESDFCSLIAKRDEIQERNVKSYFRRGRSIKRIEKQSFFIKTEYGIPYPCFLQCTIPAYNRSKKCVIAQRSL